MPCITAACALMVWGYALPAKDMPVNESPKIVLASYQPVTGCEGTQGSIEIASGCRKVPAARDRFWVTCGADYECPVAYKARHTDWGDKKLPPVTITAPKKRLVKKGPHKPVLSASATDTNTGSAPGKSNAEQIAEQLARQGVMYVAQAKAAAVGCSVGAPFGGVGCPIGAILASWGTCTPLKYAFLYQDWAAKERWDLHPEKAWGNWWWAYRMCSPAGFIFKAIEAQSGRDKGFALAEGLSWAPLLPLSIAGQVAPATNAALYNLSNFAGSTSGSVGLFGKPIPPYHNGEAWEAR